MSCFMGEVLFEGVIYLLLCTNPHNVLVNYHMISAHSVERQSDEHIHYSGDAIMLVRDSRGWISYHPKFLESPYGSNS